VPRLQARPGERGVSPHAQVANSISMDLIGERAQFDFMPLSERPNAIPQVARWWCDEWGLPQRHESMESYLSELANLKPDKLPIHLLALSGRKIVGVATLKDQSALHKLFPDFQYWLSGVYVPPALRRRGIATALCLKMVDIAKNRGVTRLHLVTEVLDGGLYAKIGWNPIRQVHADDLDLLVMARDVP
jgi:RimJ/RimL family protein N-acetyltransferase